MKFETKIISPSVEELERQYNISKYKVKEAKICQYCGVEFYYGTPRGKSCGLCFIEYECPICKTIKQRPLTSDYLFAKNIISILNDIKNNTLKDRVYVCSKECRAKYNALKLKEPGDCVKCGKFSKTRMITGLCKECYDKNIERLKGPGNCTSCGKYFKKRSITGVCNNCLNKNTIKRVKKLMGPGLCLNCGEYFDKRTAVGFCKICQGKIGSKVAENNKKPGNCLICGNFSNVRSITGLCKTCSDRTGPGECVICKKYVDKRDVCGLCKECGDRTGSGECTKCKKYVDKRNACGLCKECIDKSGPGECIKCKKYVGKRNGFGLCKECADKSGAGVCVKCKEYKDKRNYIGLCPDCSGFDRETYYSKILSPIKFQYINKSISKASLKGIEKFNKIPGVWAIWSGNECLDVCQTIDIGKEMLTVSRCLDFNKDLTDEEIEEENKRYYYNRRKKRDQAQYDDITYKIVAINIEDKEKREEIEAYYAHENKSIFWSPAPNQKI